MNAPPPDYMPRRIGYEECMGRSSVSRHRSRRSREAVLAVMAAAVAVAAGCSKTATVEDGAPDIEAARAFDRHPLYWVGERFQEWDLEHVDIGREEFVTLSYGTCPADDPDGRCAPPLQIQIQPLCAHLAAVADNSVWERRQVRGAPVGTIDNAPVMFTSRVQIKVYGPHGFDQRVPMRALRALRSLNDVLPVIGPDDPIPAAPRAVLEGTKKCGAWTRR